MSKYFVAILLTFTCLASSVRSQTLKSFNTDPSSYLLDLKSFFEETNKKEAEKIMEEFKPVFLSKFDVQQQQSIITTSNLMLKKRMKAFPDFVTYTSALTAFASSGQEATTFTSWHATFAKAIAKLSVRKLGDFLEISQLLFRNNTLYESSAVAWSSSNNKFAFGFDSLPKVTFSGMTLRCFGKGD
ncbi:MAG TPA: hypothetical protein PLJ79_04635, partial [Bacteroidia bacterium]|nr:hypothetical protein [Bacteroidia bacterium]